MKHDGSEHKGPLYYKSNISEWVVGQCVLGFFFVIILWKYKKKTNKLWAWRL